MLLSLRRAPIRRRRIGRGYARPATPAPGAPGSPSLRSCPSPPRSAVRSSRSAFT